jgi:hypothetical protein
LEEQKYQQLKREVASRREEQRLSKARKDKEEKQQLQQLHNAYLLNTLQEYKLKRLIGTETIEQAISGGLHHENTHLEQVNQDIEKDIEAL